jgi:hypothetical protein
VALADRHAAPFRALVQDHVPEQVLAAGYVSAAGAAKASAFGGPASGLARLAIGSRLGQHAGDAAASAGFPPSSWLGVTATRVYAFAAERGQVGELIGVWDRSAVTVTKSEKLATTRLSLRFGGGTSVELEARKWGAGNHQLLRYLLDPTRI